MLAALTTYLVAAMLTWSPASVHAYTHVTESDTVARYGSIATDIAAVALDPNEAPLFGGPTGRQQTALLVTAIASFESGDFRAAVDSATPTGDCHDGHCRSVCLMQLQAPYAMGIVDRPTCFRRALVAIRESLAVCRARPLEERLALYASGAPDCSLGTQASVHRMKRALRYWDRTPFNPSES